jgi:hypothetical protein
VVHAEVPDCSLTFRARSYGRVLLRALIDREGKVTSSVVEHSVPIATKCAEAAAKKWVFVPSYRDDAREAHLSFLFLSDNEETEDASHTIFSFDDPWTVRIAYARSTVRRLPRENDGIPEKRCPVHGEVMAVEVVPVYYGCFTPATVDERSPELAEWRAYRDARKKLFPETSWSTYGGGAGLEPKGEVYYCRSCREAERAWVAKHPEWRPQIPQ